MCVLTVGVQWLPESARFDMARGQPAKALATLELIARNNKKPMLIGRLVEASPLVSINGLLINACKLC